TIPVVMALIALLCFIIHIPRKSVNCILLCLLACILTIAGLFITLWRNNHSMRKVDL
ncbi:hypothetical protein MJN51_32475, partial [Salmonella enterica subsp. enterica serovar Kentucky]|nr:hypothetical protein [Salmonella enterica subsp. enterica serovar Kentucky]